MRIDQAKVLQWHNDLVRFTDNFALEKLERIYAAMAKVNFRKQNKKVLYNPIIGNSEV